MEIMGAAPRLVVEQTPIGVTPAAQGERIRLAREALGMKQIDLARASGIPPVQINRYEKGNRHLKSDDALRLCRVLHVEANFLYFGTVDFLAPGIRKALSLDDRRTRNGRVPRGGG